MSSAVAGKAIRITHGHVNNNHIPVHQMSDVSPADCFGGSNKSLGDPLISITFDEAGTRDTDIAEDKILPRIRKNDAIRKFYQLSNATDGNRIFFGKTDPRSFRATAFN